MGRKPLLMMTDAGHYEVSYVINPWMAPDAWSNDREGHLREAIAASNNLKAALEKAGAEVMTIPGVAGLPDLVFPANAAIVLDRRVLVARFSCAERQGEEAVFLEAFNKLKARGLFDEVGNFPRRRLPGRRGRLHLGQDAPAFLGRLRPALAAAKSIAEIEKFFGEKTVPLELATPALLSPRHLLPAAVRRRGRLLPRRLHGRSAGHASSPSCPPTS